MSDIDKEEAWRIEKRALVARYHKENASAAKGGIVFTGSSLMEMFPIEQWARELGPDIPAVYNRGVGGYRTDDLLPILPICVTELAPRKVFINIGTNDLNDAGEPISAIMERYERIISQIEKELPDTAIYMMAYYPVNYEAATEEMKPCLKIRTNEKIRLANEAVRRIAEKHGQRYIDVNRGLTDDCGRLKAEYTIEGMHIKPEGYRAIFDDVMRYVLE